MQDNGTRVASSTGGMREDQQGKGRFDLLPYEGIEALARWYEAGSHKYGDRNWEKGVSIAGCLSAMIRHAIKAATGWDDEDHLSAVAWNALAVITLRKRGLPDDTRPE